MVPPVGHSAGGARRALPFACVSTQCLKKSSQATATCHSRSLEPLASLVDLARARVGKMTDVFSILDDDALSECLNRLVGYPDVRLVCRRFKEVYDRAVTRVSLHASEIPPEYASAGAEITSILTSGVTLGQHTTDPLLRQLLARIRQLPTSSDRRPCLSDITIRGPITDEQLAAVALPNASRLTALRVLSAEVLTGASVNALAACVRLRDLTLHGTRGCFNDLDLTPLARCTALESLTLKRALGISGAFLADLARGCPRLATLRLFDCPLLEQRYLAAVRDMPALQHVEVARALSGHGFLILDDDGDAMMPDLGEGDPMGDVGDEAVAHLAQRSDTLRGVYLSDASVSDWGLAPLLGCGQLTRVALEGCQFVGDAGVSLLAQLPSLECLELADCGGVTDAAAAKLGAARYLRELSVSPCTGLTDAALESLGKSATLRGVTMLFVEGLSDAGVAHLARPGRLTSLALLHNHKGSLSGECLAHVSRCTGLASLRLGFLRCFPGTALAPLAHCRALTSLDVMLTDAFDEGVAAAAQLPGLERLRVAAWLLPRRIGGEGAADGAGAVAGVSDRSLSLLASRCSFLERLELPELSTLTDAGLARLSQGCTRLSHLILGRCGRVTDRGVKAILRNCRGMENLQLRDCPGLTGRFLRHVRLCRRLTSVNLRGCSDLDPSYVAHLAVCGRLQHLDVSGIRCSSSSDRARLDSSLQAVRDKCQRLVHVRASPGWVGNESVAQQEGATG